MLGVNQDSSSSSLSDESDHRSSQSDQAFSSPLKGPSAKHENQMLGMGKNRADISGIKGESGEFSVEGEIGEGLAVQNQDDGADYI